MTHKAFAIVMVWILILPGCTAIHREKIPAENIIPELKWNLESYAEFVKENITAIHANYSTVYAPYDFIVDTDAGSTMIQNLFDPEIATAINSRLRDDANPAHSDKLVLIYTHIIDHYDYDLDPYKWQSVEETARTHRGDCKSLSLLMMSLLTSAGYEAYAGISNGHMWVTVRDNYQWVVLELDQDPARSAIYHIPGFYEDPLYKIYPDRSEKRKRKK